MKAKGVRTGLIDWLTRRLQETAASVPGILNGESITLEESGFFSEQRLKRPDGVRQGTPDFNADFDIR